MVFFEEHPARPYKGAKIMSSQPGLLRDFATGLNTTQFRWEREGGQVGGWGGATCVCGGSEWHIAFG